MTTLQNCRPTAPSSLAEVGIDDLDGLPVSRHRPGAALAGGCLALERLGVGRRCETWLCWSPPMFAPAVVKIPRPHQMSHPRARRSLRREAASLAGNLHPGLARLYDDGTGSDEPYLVMEFVDGTALDGEIDDNGALTESDTALLGIQVLAALRTVHERGLVHIDLKPENIMLRGGKPVVVDFGSARRRGAEQPAGSLIGSAGYAAPELEAGDPIAVAMDLFGLGVTLFEALVGTAAYDPQLPAAERPAHPDLPAGPLGALIAELLATDPGLRPDAEQTMQRLIPVAQSDAAADWLDYAGIDSQTLTLG
ncbi:MAG TPA: serine/threonine-protein kinase [Frankiaceae bacterium]|jgi:serine/threonine protein kinase|nr:serine/threonine-protein kinase [Frankiaceae bacterium]